jgi:uncharacterized protein YraI
MKRFLMTTTVILVAAGPALAATDAQSLTDLNLRAGPGVMNEITGVIAAGDTVSVEGCIDAVDWCKVAYNGQTGWAYGPYLTATLGAEQITLVPDARRTEVVTVIEPDNGAVAPIAGASVAALSAAALAAGPIGIAAAGIAGAALADATEPDPKVETYIRANPVEPVILDGEVVVGAGVPEGITLYEVPDTEYSYLMVNGVPAVVERTDRRIVRILR